MGIKPTTTERAPPPGEHTVSSSESLEEKQTQPGKKRDKAKGEGYLRRIRRKEARKSESPKNKPYSAMLAG